MRILYSEGFVSEKKIPGQSKQNYNVCVRPLKMGGGNQVLSVVPLVEQEQLIQAPEYTPQLFMDFVLLNPLL